MAFITDGFAYIWGQLKYNYIKQPCKVTVNNIIKEFPSLWPPTEVVVSSLNKAYTIAILKHSIGPATGIDFQDIEKDNTHKGAFVQNFVSGEKNFWLWYGGVPRGTKTHGLDRVVSDVVLKGGCKVGFALSPLNEYKTFSNTLCEEVGFAFLDNKERIEFKNTSIYNISNWQNELFNVDNVIDITKKAAITSGLNQIIAMGFIKPTEHFLSKAIPQALSARFGEDSSKAIVAFSNAKVHLKNLPIVGEAIETYAYKPIADLVFWPGLTQIAWLIPVGIVIVPIVRVGIYSINPVLEVIVQHAGEVKCKKIGEVFELAENKGVSIEYKYDAHKTKNFDKVNNYGCEVKKGFIELSKLSVLSEDKDKIIIHYPVEEDWIGWGEQKLGPTISGVIEYGFETIAYAADQIENFIYYSYSTTEDRIVGSLKYAVNYMTGVKETLDGEL